MSAHDIMAETVATATSAQLSPAIPTSAQSFRRKVRFREMDNAFTERDKRKTREEECSFLSQSKRRISLIVTVKQNSLIVSLRRVLQELSERRSCESSHLAEILSMANNAVNQTPERGTCPASRRSNRDKYHAALKTPAIYKGKHLNFGDATKYIYVTSQPHPDILCFIADVVESPPVTDKYATIKRRLLDLFSQFEESTVYHLFRTCRMGDEKSSHILQRIRSLVGNNVPGVLKSICPEQVPTPYTIFLRQA
ncbi:hypothetical protein K0M31_007145 [Melipona bicolor]|uniref:Uncharacterized protein n=1 Tax=Melipona bicolor TaxID=60889 RepID=A0AA40KL03_9HYME|nr:hypothetical protein K0M31_007145 [Melipona bicolor]